MQISYVVTVGDSLLADDLFTRDPVLYGPNFARACASQAAAPFKAYAVGGDPSWNILGQANSYAAKVGNGTDERASVLFLDGGANDVKQWAALYTASWLLLNEKWFANQTINNLKNTFAVLRTACPQALIVPCTIPPLYRFLDIPLNPTLFQFVTAYVADVNNWLKAAAQAQPNTLVLDLEAVYLARFFDDLTIGQTLVHGFPDYGTAHEPPLVNVWISDGVHPSNVGNEWIANALIGLINPLLSQAIPVFSDAQLEDAATL